MGSSSDPRPGSDEMSLEGRVRRRAYLLWESNGCPEGMERHYWLTAEAIEHQEAAIDEEEEESFPASDPPSHTPSNGPKIG